MTAHVLFTNHTTVGGYHFVGPFPTETHAGLWADKYHPDTWWFVIELEDPGAVPPTVFPPLFPQVISARQSKYDFILCWDDRSFHLIGPFADKRAIRGYINAVNGDDPDDDDCSFGPYNDMRWYAVTLDAPPGPPKVFSAPPMTQIPLRVMRRQAVKKCKRARRIDEMYMRALVAAGLIQPRRGN
jgi:hypothetical protein